MKFHHFAFKNLMRNKWRTVLTITSMAIATLTLFIVFSVDKGYKMAVEEELVKNTGVHLYVSREGCPMAAAAVIAQGGISPLYVSEDTEEKVQNVKGVKAVMPFNVYALTTSDGSRTDIFFGITEEIQRIRPNWKLKTGSYFKNDATLNSIILGAELAKTEKRNVGDKVYFEQFDKEFEVSGILENNYTQDDGSFFLPLKIAQKLIHREGKLSAVAIQVEDVGQIDKIKLAIEVLLPKEYFIVTAEALSGGVLSFFGSTRAIMLVMVIIALIVSGLGIMNTMLMTAIERKKEFAYLKCVGAGVGDIIKLIFLETIIISLIGVFTGLVATGLVSSVFESFIKQHLVSFVPKAAIVRLSLDRGVLSALIIILSGMFASFYPAIRSAKVTPMEAIRND